MLEPHLSEIVTVIIAIMAVAVGYGELRQRVNGLGARVRRIEERGERSGDRIEERLDRIEQKLAHIEGLMKTDSRNVGSLGPGH